MIELAKILKKIQDGFEELKEYATNVISIEVSDDGITLIFLPKILEGDENAD